MIHTSATDGEAPRDCTHPAFPLRKRCRTLRGKPYAEWVRKIRKKRVSFGACVNDPTGFLAWQLYDAERKEWEGKKNPRAGFRRLSFVRAYGRWNPSWLLSGPLAQAGVAIIDKRHGTFMCLNCYAKWSVRFREDEPIPTRALTCPHRCSELPLVEVKEAIEIARYPALISWQYLEAIEKAKEKGWLAAPQDIDAEAEIEGDALKRFAAYTIRQARRRKAPTINHREIAAHIARTK